MTITYARVWQQVLNFESAQPQAVTSPAVISDTSQDMSSSSALYILKVRNKVERSHLLKLLDQERLKRGLSDSYSCMIVGALEEQPARVISELAGWLKNRNAARIIPVSIAWQLPAKGMNRDPHDGAPIIGNPRAPSALRAWFTLQLAPHRARQLVGKSATVQELRLRLSQQNVTGDFSVDQTFAEFVLRQAGLTLESLERELHGQRYKAPRYVAASLMSRPTFRRDMNELSLASDKPESELYRDARKFMRELVSKPTPFYIDLKARIDRFMLSQGYEKQVVFDESQVEKLRNTIQEKPTLLLFTHKAYLDGVTPTDIAYKHDLPMLHVFGGINLDFFGLGFILRRAGTIFIRRNFENQPVYKLVLRHYISYLLEKRFPMTWAFEGTRSRLGKLMPPRYGLLKYVMDSAQVNDIRDINIIPVVTSFDLIRDVSDYVDEQSGKAKKPESFLWFMNYLKSLKQPMGKVYVDFGEPVVVEQAPQPSDRLGISKIAFKVAVQANKATPLTLTSLLCLSLLGLSPRGMTAEELQLTLKLIVEWAKQRGIRYSHDLTQENLADVNNVIEALVQSELMLCYDQGSTTIYTIEPDKHALASYYRNSIIHHFLDKAIIELSLYKARESQSESVSEIFWAETERLRELFKFEFFYPEKDQFRANIEAELNRTDPNWQLKLSGDGTGLASLCNRFQPLVCHAVFLPFVEAYTIVLELLLSLKPGESLSRKDCVERALDEGRQAYLLRRITSEASIGKILFENGYKMASKQGVVRNTESDVHQKRKQLHKELTSLSRRIERARLDTLRLADKVFH